MFLYKHNTYKQQLCQCKIPYIHRVHTYLHTTTSLPSLISFSSSLSVNWFWMSLKFSKKGINLSLTLSRPLSFGTFCTLLALYVINISGILNTSCSICMFVSMYVCKCVYLLYVCLHCIYLNEQMSYTFRKYPPGNILPSLWAFKGYFLLYLSIWDGSGSEILTPYTSTSSSNLWYRKRK